MIANLARLGDQADLSEPELRAGVRPRLSPNRRARALVQRLRARPYAFVAQEHLAFSQAPVWRTRERAGFAARRSRSASMRSRRRRVSGHARRSRALALRRAAEIVSMQRGGGSKDIWVLSDHSSNEAPEFVARFRHSPVRGDDIPSRLVENLYWFGRYTARCEDKARLLRATLAARIDEGVWNSAVKRCRELGVIAVGRRPDSRFTGRSQPARHRC